MEQQPIARPVLKHMQPYSPGKPIWEVKDQWGLDEVYKLASNENPLGASPKAVEALIGCLPEIHRYPDASATLLRRAIADKYGVGADQVMVGNGADELITLISETYLQERDEIIVPEPTFTEYEFGANLMGARIKRVSLAAGFAYDLDALFDAITDRTKIVYLCSPHNPTGTYVTKEQLGALARRLPPHVLLVFDGAYSHYATAEDYSNGVELVLEGMQAIVLQTFSKIYGLAGLRVGFALSSSAIIRQIGRVKEPFNVNVPAQAAAAAALTDDEHVANSVRLNAEGRSYLYNAFEGMGIPYTPSMSNFVLAEFGDKAAEIYDKLMRRGVIVRHGSTWGLPEHIRVTVGNEKENRRFIETLKEVL